jgi:ribosomal-protein-alanine N-acetyltransferase
MTEALGAVLSYGFDTMGLHRVYVRNAPSRALLRKLGFREEGILRQNTRHDGIWEDTALMAILKSDWV